MQFTHRRLAGCSGSVEPTVNEARAKKREHDAGNAAQLAHTHEGQRKLAIEVLQHSEATEVSGAVAAAGDFYDVWFFCQHAFEKRGQFVVGRCVFKEMGREDERCFGELRSDAPQFAQAGQLDV